MTSIGAHQPGNPNIGAWESEQVHAFDLATYWPANATIMNLVNWFGIGPDDPTAAGDEKFSNGWDVQNSKGWHTNDPVSYPYVPYWTADPDICTSYGAGQHRDIGSKLRPIAGIYSNTGRDAESIARLNLTLELLRQDGEARARVTVISLFCHTVVGTIYADKEIGDDGFIAFEDVQYRGVVAYLAAADSRGLTNCIMPQYMPNSLWESWHSEFTTDASRIEQNILDIGVYLALMDASPAAHRVNGRLVLEIYTTLGASTLDNDDYAYMVNEARNNFDGDFYVVAYSKDGARFVWADAAHPWTSFVEWSNTDPGLSERARAEAWQIDRMDNLVAALPTYPGRVVLGCLSPGKTDWGMEWGQGTVREIPRTEATMLGQVDGMPVSVTSFYMPTWDDWTEGQTFEPDVKDRGSQLGWLTEAIGGLYSETIDPAETQALLARWINYGIVRGCAQVALGHGRAHHYSEPKRNRTSATNRGPIAGGSLSTFNF